MKKMNRILAFTLAVVLALSCFGSALAAEPTAPVKRANTVESPATVTRAPELPRASKVRASVKTIPIGMRMTKSSGPSL